LVAASAAAKTPATGSVPQAPELVHTARLLRNYYADFNSMGFVADRYFGAKVERYITLINTTPRAINRYIAQIFLQQYKQHEFRFQEGTLVRTAADHYSFEESASYLEVARRRHSLVRSRVSIKLSKGKIISFQHDKVLWRQDQAAP
jgi:hypothetical protein